MQCPICHQAQSRRSRRRSITDHTLSIIGVYPWRCSSCQTRYHARLMPIMDSLHAHCPVCGNQDLKRISSDYVDSAFAPIGRLLRLPAFRCEPCRYKYFSLLPPRRSAASSFTATTD